MKWIEDFLVIEHYAKLLVTIEGDDLTERDIRVRLRENGIEVAAVSVVTSDFRREYSLNVRDFRRPRDVAVPQVVEELSCQPGVRSVKWQRAASPA
jgi:hypothetical protein